MHSASPLALLRRRHRPGGDHELAPNQGRVVVEKLPARADPIYGRLVQGDFTQESRMTPVACEAWGRWWGARTAPDFIAREVVGPEAIADIVGVRFDPASLELRLAAGIRPLPDRLALLAVLATRRRALTTRQLAAQCCVSPSGMRRAITAAVEANALVADRPGAFAAHLAWRPVVARTVAVELKLASWRRALLQARLYRSWANASWVILSGRPSTPACALAAEAGVGLATLRDTGAIDIVVRPTARRLRTDWATVWTGEQMLAQTQAGSSLQAPEPNREMRGLRHPEAVGLGLRRGDRIAHPHPSIA